MSAATPSGASARASACCGSPRSTATRASRPPALALYAGARSYRPVKTILQHNLDTQPLPEPEAPAAARAPHENVRGRDYYH